MAKQPVVRARFQLPFGRKKPPVPSFKPLKPPAPEPRSKETKRSGFLFWRREVKSTAPTFKPLKPQAAPAPKPEVRRLTRREQWHQFTQRVRAPLRSLSLVGAGVVVAVIALLVFSAINPGPPRLTSHDVDVAIASAMASATPPPAVAASVYQQVALSIVHIDIHQLDDKGQRENGHGTGIVLDQNGTVLTSLHVVKSALDIKVTFYDGSQSTAMVAGSEPDKDIAVLRTFQPPAQLIPATLGNPRAVHPGDQAVVIGDPFGLSTSVSAGTISGLGRTFVPPNNGTPMSGLIQFDAAVNPGNSGGPLLNRNGEVIGVVTGLVNPTGQDVFIGIGFAVPIDVAAGAAGSPPY